MLTLITALCALLGLSSRLTLGATLGYWRFEEGSGTTASDNSGSGRDGALFGGATFDQTCAPCFTLNQSSVPNAFGLHIHGAGGVSVAPDVAPRPETAITIEGFFKLEPDAWVWLGMQLGIDPWYHNSYQIEFDRFSPGRVSFRLWDVATGPHEVIANCGSLDGKLHHLAGTWDGATMRLYCDGGLIGSTPLAGRIYYADQRPFLIGGDSDVTEGVPSCCYFQGCIDEVRISDEALDPESFLTPCGPSTLVQTKTWGLVKLLYR